MTPRGRSIALWASLGGSVLIGAFCLAGSVWASWAALDAFEQAEKEAPLYALSALLALVAAASMLRVAKVAYWALRRPWASDLRRALDELGDVRRRGPR